MSDKENKIYPGSDTGNQSSRRHENREEQNYRMLFNLGSDARYVHPLGPNGSGVFTEVNDMACRNLGYTREELLQLSPNDIDANLDPAFVKKNISVLLEKGNVMFETAHIHKSGKHIPVEINSQLFTLDDTPMVMSIARDISRRRETDKILKEKNDFLNSILNAISHPFFVINAETYQIEAANSAVGKTGLTTCHKLTHGSDYPCESNDHVCPLQTVKKTKKTVITEHIHFDSDGRKRFVEVHGYPIFDDNGNVVRMIEYSLDITERKLAEQALKQRIDMESLISKISTRFLAIQPEKLDESINWALNQLGEFCGVVRSYLFLVGEDRKTISNTHEWCAPGVEPHIDQFQNFPFSSFPVVFEKIQNLETFEVPRVSELPIEAEKEKKRLLSQDIHAIICAPMVYGNVPIGFIGIDSKNEKNEWAEEDRKLLEIVGIIFSNAIMLKKDREALEESERRMRGITLAALDAIVMIDEWGHITFWNPAAEKIFGYTKEEAIGKELHQIVVPAKYHSIIHKGYTQFQKSGTGEAIGKSLELTAKNRDGNEFPVELSLSAFKIKDRWHAVGIVRDITERKAAAEETAKLANVVKQAYDSILLTDISGHIEYVNPAFENLTGYSSVEVLGKNPSILKSPASNKSPEEIREMWETIQGGNVWTGEFTNRKKNGEDFIEEASIFPITDPATGKISRFGAVKSDITARRKLEKQLQESLQQMRRLKEEAESANLLKSRFLANMSHDIRTPLNSMLGYADLMLKRETAQESIKPLETIKNSGKALLALLNDILDFSKIEAGQMSIYKETFFLKDIVDNIVSIFEIRARQQQLKFTADFADNLPEVIYSDRWRLHQVLSNLLSNAFKFTEEGGVTLGITYDATTDAVTFRVADTGRGISEENLKDIFQPFFQVDSDMPLSRKTSGSAGKGAGLGLAICRNIMDLLGGRINVKSILQEGTEFSVSIPVESKRVQVDAARLIRKQNGVDFNEDDVDPFSGNELPIDIKSKLILIVDDNDVNREILTVQLKNEGYHQLLHAENGYKAIETVTAAKPALVLMDTQMPGMDGNEAIATLRRMKYDRPIIAVSAYAMREDIEKSLKMGADAYMTKPIDFDILFKKMRRFLRASADTEVQTDTSKATGVITDATQISGSMDRTEPWPVLKIATNVSENVKRIFLEDLEKNIGILDEIIKQKGIENKRSVIKPIVHSYRGNAGYMGLSGFMSIAAGIDDRLMDKNESKEKRERDLCTFLEMMKTILKEN